jgi:3-hydroxyacyl-CoA dehydrogenase/enoyl-CoA hydratase/3-hydroxybutyryl-CoA epimerase
MNALVLDPTQDPDQDRVPHLLKALHTPAAFKLEVDLQGIAWLTFDQPGSSVNVLNEDTLRELDDHLDALELDPTIHALVIRSAKEKVFVAGADLKAIRNLPPSGVRAMIELGQAVFSRLAALPIPKVAAIHGACVGGGFELALACDARVASDDDTTRIGLPETQLGLIPAWGGSTRLPRLVGLPKALDLILSGKLVKAAQALRLGMVDRRVPREHLDAMASKLVQLPTHQTFHAAHLPLVPSLIAWKAKREVMAKTRGLYEAPLRALEVVTRGVRLEMDESLRSEREAVAKLVQSSTTANLIDLFFRKEEASKKPWATGHALPVTKAAVIGAGVMGAGIAQWLASRGVRVVLSDISTEALGKGMKRIRDLTDEATKRRVLSRKEGRETLDLIAPTHQPVPLHGCQLVIEAATEDMELKKRIFASLASRCGPDTILATNTSALSVAELSQHVPHPERVIGLHFFNPVHRMGLIEVITLPETNADVLATAHAFVQRIGKTPVVVKDSPGFVVNRVLMPYLMEAVKLFESGHSPEAIDEAMLDFGMPMGPMRLLDEIGLDVALHVGKTFSAAYPDRMATSDLLERMASNGWLGKKSGKGFYLHHGCRTPMNREALALRSNRPMADVHPDGLQDHLASMLSDEAQRCLKDGVVAKASDIDLAMVLGTGYAPFRGGPLVGSNISMKPI